MISLENRRMEVEDSSGDQCKELKGIYKLLVGYVGDLHTYTKIPIHRSADYSILRSGQACV